MSNSFVDLSRGSIFPKVVFNTILSLIKLKEFFFNGSLKKDKKDKIRTRKIRGLRIIFNTILVFVKLKDLKRSKRTIKFKKKGPKWQKRP